MRHLSCYVFAALVAVSGGFSACKSDSAQGESSAIQGATTGEASTQGESGDQPKDDGAQSAIRPMQIGGKRWWDNRTIYFMDMVGGTEDIVYEEIKGQKFFPETRMFVYCTDEAMKGTVSYNKTEMTLEGTEVADRIFIWVHLDNDRNVLHTKTLISDNIKDKVQDAPNMID